MILLPIDIDDAKNTKLRTCIESEEVLNVYPAYYQKIGFLKPWIGYLATIDGQELLGAGGYKGAPKEGRVEIAYGTFEKYRQQGTGTEICRQLIQLCWQTDPAIIIMARTLPVNMASIRILQKHGFTCLGMVMDKDDGDVLEWELLPQR